MLHALKRTQLWVHTYYLWGMCFSNNPFCRGESRDPQCSEVRETWWGVCAKVSRLWQDWGEWKKRRAPIHLPEGRTYCTSLMDGTIRNISAALPLITKCHVLFAAGGFAICESCNWGYEEILLVPNQRQWHSVEFWEVSYYCRWHALQKVKS